VETSQLNLLLTQKRTGCILRSHLFYCLSLTIRSDTDRCLSYILFKIYDNGVSVSFLDQIFWWFTILVYRSLSWKCTYSFLQFKPIFAPCSVPHRHEEQAIPFCFMHYSFTVYCHSSFQTLLFQTKNQFFQLFLVGSHSPAL